MKGNTIYNIEADVKMQLVSLKWIDALFNLYASKALICCGTNQLPSDMDITEWFATECRVEQYIVKDWMPRKQWVKSRGSWVKVSDIVKVDFRSVTFKPV